MTKLDLILFTYIILLKTTKNLVIKDKECSLLSPKYFGYSPLLKFYSNMTTFKEFKNFNDLGELNLNCSMNIEVFWLIFIPNNEIYFDNTFSFAPLFYHLNYLNGNNEISFLKVKGFNHVTYKKVYKYFDNYFFSIENGVFDFYFNYTKVDKNMCKLSNFKNGTNFFGAILMLKLSYMLYSKNTCPFMFINTKLKRLILNHLSNSLLIKNQLEFLNINQTEEFDLNNRELNYLKVSLAFEDVTLKLLNKHVFKYLNKLIILNVIGIIQSDLFSHFKYLKFLCLNLENLESFLHNTDNIWMKYLNNDINVDMDNLTDVRINILKTFTIEINSKIRGMSGAMTSFESSYSYPNQDFCLFKYFPHEHLVYPVLFSAKLKCTCTIMWLIKYLKTFDQSNLVHSQAYYFINYYDSFTDYDSGVYGCYHANFTARIKECNFTQRLNLCNKSIYKISNSLNDLEIFYDIKWIELIVFVYLQPAFCIVGFITNSLSILTIKQHLNFKNEKDKSMMQHILINSIFNLFYCFLTLFKSLNVCIFQISSYCSSIYAYESTQYILIIIYFLSNVIKLCCNVSYISFALSRFSLSLNDIYKNRLIKKFDLFNIKLFYLFTIIACCFLSIFKLFQYQINEIFNTSKSFPFEKFDIGSCQIDNFYCILFRYLNIINYILRDFLFFVSNLIIDICLFRNSKANLENKKKLTSDKLNLNAAIKSKNKIARMIFVNGVLFLIAHTPEFFTRILLLTFENKLYDFCNIYLSCNDLTDIAEFFTFISVSFQFFVYKNFNKNFNSKFNVFKQRITVNLYSKILICYNSIKILMNKTF